MPWSRVAHAVPTRMDLAPRLPRPGARGVDDRARLMVCPSLATSGKSNGPRGRLGGRPPGKGNDGRGMRAHAQQEGTIQIRQARRDPAGRRTIWRLHAGGASEDGSAIRRAHGVGLSYRPRAADRHRLTPQQEHAAILATSRIGTFLPALASENVWQRKFDQGSIRLYGR